MALDMREHVHVAAVRQLYTLYQSNDLKSQDRKQNIVW